MVKCPACGEENPPKFRLCGYCGAPLAAAAAAALPAHEVRKTVTLVFTDLKDSTALGERLDRLPSGVAARLNRQTIRQPAFRCKALSRPTGVSVRLRQRGILVKKI